MSDDRETLLRELVHSAAARDQHRDEPDLPIIVLWGSRGSERFEPLARLDREMDWSGPHAFLDGEQLADAFRDGDRLTENLRPYEIAGWLAFRLGERVPRFGRARFPRLFLGMWAARNPLDPKSVVDARRVRRDEIKRTFRGRSELRNWVSAVGKVLASAAGAPEPVTEVLGLALAGALDFMSTRKLLRGAGMRWYADGLANRRFADPVDGLVELSVQEFLGDFEFVDEVLCRAFVDDLRAEFEAGGRTPFTPKANAVVLLDNVGTPELGPFVTMLAEQRAGSGPLLVVAASHRRYPPAASAEPSAWQPEALRQASLAGWSRWRERRDQSRFYPVWVDPIEDVPPTAGPTRPAVRAIARQRDLNLPAFPKLAFAHRLTAAHPDGLEMILSSLPANPSENDLRGVLGLHYRPGQRRDHTPPDQRLDDVVFDLVLGRWTDDMRRGLVLMAIGVDLSNARIAPVQADSTERGRELITEFRAGDLWVNHYIEHGSAGPPRLHPFARRSIAHRLARPGGISSPPVDLRWDQAHELLRDAAVARGDELAALYHRLALGRVHEVAARLSALFDPVDPRPWYELLLSVASAPLAAPAGEASARAHFGKLIAASEPDPLVSRRLVAALQLHSDPLGDPRHEMCGVIRNQLNGLARHAADGAPFLIERGAKFGECKERWDAVVNYW